MNEEESEFQVEPTRPGNCSDESRSASIHLANTFVPTIQHHSCGDSWWRARKQGKGVSGMKVPESELRSCRFLDVYPWLCPVLDAEDSVHGRKITKIRKALSAAKEKS